MDKATRIAGNLVGIYVSVEILWSFLNPSEPHLYELAADRLHRVRERVEYRREVLATLRSIWRLPEHDA